VELATDKMIARKDGAIGWMVFNNPARRNAVSLEMWEAIPQILAEYDEDPAIRVIVVTGAGEKAFVSGADISQFEKERATPEQVRHYESVSGRAGTMLAGTAKPTIAMIRGYCIGGGLTTAMSCDLRIAAADSRFGIPAARLGLGYGARGVEKLVHLVGPAFAKEIFYTARQFDAEEALQMGLVNRVVPVDALEEFVRGYAEKIAENAPLTIRAVKTTIGEAVKDPGRRDEAAVKAAVEACFASEDYKEGRRAFMEKRKPAFQGR